MSYFELRTPRDLLGKAQREYGRLTVSFNIDNVFNFFVTANHIKDYVRKASAIPRATLDAFLKSQDIQDAHDLCDKGKHLYLTQRPDPITNRRLLGALGTVPLNTLVLGGSKEVWELHTGNRIVDVAALADRIIQQWEVFFAANGI